MDDDIELPPLQPAPDHVEVMRAYARAAVLADRERQALWEAQPAKPQVHEARLSLAAVNAGMTEQDDSTEASDD